MPDKNHGGIDELQISERVSDVRGRFGKCNEMDMRTELFDNRDELAAGF